MLTRAILQGQQDPLLADEGPETRESSGVWSWSGRNGNRGRFRLKARTALLEGGSGRSTLYTLWVISSTPGQEGN